MAVFNLMIVVNLLRIKRGFKLAKLLLLVTAVKALLHHVVGNV